LCREFHLAQSKSRFLTAEAVRNDNYLGFTDDARPTTHDGLSKLLQKPQIALKEQLQII
jgi:hypothetical protein